MFVSHYERTIDKAGRLILPPQHRTVLGSSGFLAMYHGCIGIWPPQAWTDFVEKIVGADGETTAQSRAAKRSLLTKAIEVHPDGQGRITIPDLLAAHASLDREVIVAGNDDHLEIWDREAWDALQEDDARALEELIAAAGL